MTTERMRESDGKGGSVEAGAAISAEPTADVSGFAPDDVSLAVSFFTAFRTLLSAVGAGELCFRCFFLLGICSGLSETDR